MSVVVVGLEHRKVPLDVLERATFPESDMTKVLGALRDVSNLQESVVLSTCLRTEVYAVADRFHDAVEEIQEMLAAKTGLAKEDLESRFTVRFDDEVAAHLFSVAAGIESVVIGETEVLGQVRRAWERAQEERASGPVLAELFRHALEAGKRVRTETVIARGTISFSHGAVEMAEAHLAHGLAGATAVVLGAGELGEGVFRALTELPEARRPAQIVLVNRTTSRAEELVQAAPLGATVRFAPASALQSELAHADVMVAAIQVDADLHPVTVSDVAPLGSRSAEPLLIVDLGVPRNVHPEVGMIPGTVVLDMDDLSASVTRATEERQGEVADAREIVADEVARHREAVRARGAAPIIGALRTRLESLRVTELDRHRNRFADLNDAEWEVVEAATRSVLAKLVHVPTTVLKDTAGTARGERLVESLRTLFDL